MHRCALNDRSTWVTLLLGLVLLRCGDGSDESVVGAGGRAGSVAVGGTLVDAGSDAAESAGSAGTGAATGTGGAPASGGEPATGGDPGSGGDVPAGGSGGSLGVGGAATGGNGGMTGVGGAVGGGGSSGGSAGVGGDPDTGGSAGSPGVGGAATGGEGGVAGTAGSGGGSAGAAGHGGTGDFGFDIRIPEQGHSFWCVSDDFPAGREVEFNDTDWLCTFEDDGLSGDIYVQATPTDLDWLCGPVMTTVVAQIAIGGQVSDLQNAQYDWGPHHNDSITFDYGGKSYEYYHSSFGSGWRACQPMDCMLVDDGETIDDGCTSERTRPVVCVQIQPDGSHDELADTFERCPGDTG